MKNELFKIKFFVMCYKNELLIIAKFYLKNEKLSISNNFMDNYCRMLTHNVNIWYFL